MKNIFLALLFLSTSMFSQNFEKNWNEVIENENAGKIKTANAIVEKIHKKAIANKDEVQIIKCFFYESKYLQVVDENAQTKIIRNLKTEINRTSLPSKAILNFVYAKCLNDYLTKNQYSLQKRTPVDSISNDFLTWTKSDFEKQIQNAYEKTLENEVILRQTPLTKYEGIFDFLTLEKFKEQNLFDYLLKENISYYTSKTNQWEIQSKDFKDHNKTLLGNSDDFIKLEIDYIKNKNLKKVLSLYQKQESTHPSAANQLERIQFCHNYIVKSSNDYINSLRALQNNSKDEILLQKIQLEKATIYAGLASKEFHTDYNVKAISILDSIINVENHSNIYKLAFQKKQSIRSKSLYIQLEKYIYPNENTRAFVKYKNVAHLKISFFKINQKMVANFENRILKKDSLLAIVTDKGKLLQSNNYPLINKKDYFEYSTEILLPQLETGSYLVYFESDGDEKTSKAFAYETITVSDFTVLAYKKEKEEYYQVLNRKTGKPIENVTIKSSQFNIKTNSEGLAIHTTGDAKAQNVHETIELSNVTDTIRISKKYISYTNDYSNKDNLFFKAKSEFYLDRAIYRPGQTVFYKGIIVQKKKGKTNVVPNLTVKIIIEDADYNDFKEFYATTNEFGSFSGEFILPKNGLTGEFRIKAEEPDDTVMDPLYDKEEKEHPFWDNVDFDDSSTSFRVEEYKRPKFEATFESVKETYLVNQKINVRGKAKAFAGSNISDAKVSYVVTFLAYNTYRENYYTPNGTPEIIATGETKTDPFGKFSIEFDSRSFEKFDKESLPVFNYKIVANVTDINGETHSTETNVKVGYHSLVLKASLPTIIETKDKNTIDLSSNNLNNQFVATKGTIKIYFIREFPNKVKARVWAKPEIEGITDADFERLFPYEKNEKPIAENETGTLIYSKKVDTQKDKTIPMDFISDYKSGHYKLEFSATDKFGTIIKNSKTFYLTQSKDVVNPSKLFTVKQLNEDPKKDGFVKLKITSDISELYINTAGNYQGKVFFEENCILKNNQAILKIPLGKEFKNAVKIGFESVFENQTFNEELGVILKTEEPKMKFEAESFRNKIEPGSKENWSFKLSSTNTSTEAEILASMYDSSLDQFTTKSWSGLQIHENNYNYYNRKTNLGFDRTNSYLRNLNAYSGRIELNNEDTKLMWFGFHFNETDNPKVLKEYQKEITKKSKKPRNAKMISGIVTDGENPLPGVSVLIKGTQRGTQTDFDGYYKIEAAIGEELTLSYIGFETQKIVINANVIDVQLEESSNSLQEVVVVGLGIKRDKKYLGYAVQTEEDNTIYNYAGIDYIDKAGVSGKVSGVTIRGISSLENAATALYIVDGVPITAEQMKSISPSDIISVDVLKGKEATALYGSQAANGVIIITTKIALEALTQVKARTNLSETAFFFPNLKTDSKGKISFSFSSPEALTAWKLRLLAHNKEAASGYLEKAVITQKELMVMPNFPRFLREKDTIVITTKIANLTNEAKTGIAVLQLFDASTMQAIDIKTLNTKNIKNFTIAAFGNTTASWKITIPEGLQGVQYKVLAKSGSFSDGEENILPVLTNTILVTESIPIWVRENSKKEYSFYNLKNNTSTSLRNHQFTLEYTSNPSWIAIQSLPYLMEYEHECAEQTFARFYANALASEIISSNPKIASLFETWRKNGKLNAKTEENEELQSIILAETPWLNDAQNEDEKKKNLALLFDLEKMKTSQEATFDKLKQKQNSSGGFAWFDGNDENEYITRHILAGLGHLKKLTVKTVPKEKIVEISKTGIPFIDRKFLENYKKRTEELKDKYKMIWLNPYSDLHYLYTRSFYLDDFPLSDTLKKATQHYLETAKANWLSYSLYEKGLAALVLHRFGESNTAKKIIESLKETSSNNEDWGMYWTANKAGWYWHQAPVETQALLIEAFFEISNDTKAVDAMKVWLLKNKQTKNWPTTKSTTEAIYALLLQGTNWLSVKDNTIIKIGAEKILTKKLAENEKEAETGYVKLNWKADEIKKDMATLSIENKSKVPGFGGVYWQYFEDLDKIKTNSGAVLSVSKELYIKKSTDKGEKLELISSNNLLKIGNLVTVRLLITAKEDMEFVHLKDMRASCFEPVSVLSEYQYKDGLGFYRSTKDAATHFFFDSINKGTYVLEYDIRVNNQGDFSNGISTIESMYAPEFTSHTKGIRVNIKE
jgi:TonB-dependent SusC/RagA subfamily outer membrane receptor